jgi:hypothetical protein
VAGTLVAVEVAAAVAVADAVAVGGAGVAAGEGVGVGTATTRAQPAAKHVASAAISVRRESIARVLAGCAPGLEKLPRGCFRVGRPQDRGADTDAVRARRE